jgi:hypothetical protein
MQTVIKYGISNQLPPREFDSNFTVGELLTDSTTLGYLSAPEGCVAVSGGETLSSHDLVSHYRTITLEKQASSKAV